MLDVNLPNPGGGRYWQITESRGMMNLELREAHGSIVATEQLFVYSEGNDDEAILFTLGEAAKKLLTEAKLKSLIGTYKFEGDN